MATVTSYTSHSSGASGFSKSGDVLLNPLRWCGSRWNHLCEKENSEKTFQVARKTILGSMLTIATSLAFVPAVAGSFIKSRSHTLESREDYLTLTMDSKLKERCRQIGINNPGQNNDSIEEELIRRLPQNLFICVGSHPKQPASDKIIYLQVSGSGNNFFKNLVNCFYQTRKEDANIIKALPDLILGVKRTTDEKPNKQLLRIIKSSSRIYLQIPENLERMDIRILK